MATDKRARKRAVRDARQAALRRRRNARLGGIAAFIAVAVVVALLAGRDSTPTADDKEPSPEPAAAAACGAEPPAEANAQEYKKANQVLAKGADYRAVIHTSCGDIEMDLFEADAPKSVNSFVFLAKEGYFDGMIWHRISNNFVIQTGDPNGLNGQPPDGPGYSIPDENLPDKGNAYSFGVVAMANSGPDTSGSQWFIISHLGPDGDIEPAGLDPFYSVFGQVAESSFETVKEIAKQETRGGNDPVQAEMPIVPVYIESIEIVEA